MAKELKPGYILHADPAWADFHLAHSVGGDFGYTRRAGAPMQNVAAGGHGFFLRRGEPIKLVGFWGNFIEDVLTTPAAAWQQFESSLGAPTFDAWFEESL